MKPEYTIVCRGSWLSLAQAEIFKKKVAAIFPQLKLNILVKETAGDKNQSTPLHLVEGKDFFTKEIQDALKNGEADFAVHSMKDVSSEDFFSNSHYSIIDRELLNDVAIFNADVTDKLSRAEQIRIGTSSPRRTNMSIAFLGKALPALNGHKPVLQAAPVRGNVDTRLKKLSNGEYDGLILAAAGLNRLLQYADSVDTVSALLLDKKIMFLPLFECPPAAGQGAIVAETGKDNADAVIILQAIKDEMLTKAVESERKIAHKHGYGCSQQFGVFHLDLPNISFTYASGQDDKTSFSEWDFELPAGIEEKTTFSSTSFMKDFFRYYFINDPKLDDGMQAFFVASHKAVQQPVVKKAIEGKCIWAAGTRTWLALSAQGIWVEGSADGLGLEWAVKLFESPLAGLKKEAITILTNTAGKRSWEKEGWKAVATYELDPVFDEKIAVQIRPAELLFWTSFHQYEIYKELIRQDAVHACPAGKTASLFKAEGINPVIFPTIKAFTEWTKKHTTTISAG